MPIELISDWKQCYERTLHCLLSSEPYFLSRIGGSDTNALVNFYLINGDYSLEKNTEKTLHHAMKV